MPPVALPSFEIRGFRAFEYLNLERLGRVNLFVGKNNVGKTSLLESLWVYANQGAPSILWSLLVDRDEAGSLNEPQITADKALEDLTSEIRYLFYGRQPLKNGDQMEFGTSASPEQRVVVKFILTGSTVDDQGNRRIQEARQSDVSIYTAVPALSIQFGKSNSMVALSRIAVRNFDQYPFQWPMEKPCVFVPANGVTGESIGKYWDRITLGPLENDVLDTMKIIEPGIERINLISTQKTSRLQERTPIVKVRSSDSPVPLRSVGEGMNRMFGMALALVNAKDGILLIDEIESGLHYSILPDMWNLIFQAARRLNVQVFATTHSWDCITGFQQAAEQSEQDGMLIRLENKKGKIIPTFFDEKRLAIVTREQIEVR